jgi:hypothetical protein
MLIQGCLPRICYAYSCIKWVQKVNCEFMLHEHIGCVKLLFFWIWYLKLDFCVLMFFVCVLDSNMFVYVSVSCWDKKNMFWKQKMLISGLESHIC